MSDETGPFIGEATDGSLEGVHTISVVPWPDLRWFHLGDQRIAVRPEPEADLTALVEQVVQETEELRLKTMVWDDVVRVILEKAGVPGLLDEIARLQAAAQERS